MPRITQSKEDSMTKERNIAPKKAGIGHNSGQPKKVETSAQDVGGIAGQRLKSFIERIERLEEEKTHIAEDIKETYSELKGVGFDVKTIRQLVRLRKLDPEKRREAEELIDLYKTSIGMV